MTVGRLLINRPERWGAGCGHGGPRESEQTLRERSFAGRRGHLRLASQQKRPPGCPTAIVAWSCPTRLAVNASSVSRPDAPPAATPRCLSGRSLRLDRVDGLGGQRPMLCGLRTRGLQAESGYDPNPPPLARHISERIWCGRRDSNPHSQRETDFLTTSAFAAASRRSWPGLSLRHGLSAEGAARPVSTPSLNRGLGSGLAWGSSPLAFPDFERFCSTNFPVGTPIGSLLRLPISPRPLCHIGAITRLVARWRILGQFQHLAPVRLLASIPSTLLPATARE